MLLLPSLADVVGVAGTQWGEGEVPEGARLGRGWWDVEDVGDSGDGDEEEKGEGKEKDKSEGVEGKDEEEEKEPEKEEGELSDSEIPDVKPSKPNHRSPPPLQEDDLDVPILKREHYAPRVIALAKRMAARRGVRVCVDPKAGRDVSPPPSTKSDPPAPILVQSLPVQSPAVQSPIPAPALPAPETRDQTPSSEPPMKTDTPTKDGNLAVPLGKGMRGRARGRGTGRWAGHWAAKAARAGAAGSVGGGVAGSGNGQTAGAAGRVVSGSGGIEEKEEGPEAEKRRKREVGTSLGNSSWWCVLSVFGHGIKADLWVGTIC